jgi:hypothetical protein
VYNKNLIFKIIFLHDNAYAVDPHEVDIINPSPFVLVNNISLIYISREITDGEDPLSITISFNE